MVTTVVTVIDRATGRPKKRMTEEQFKSQYPSSGNKTRHQGSYRDFQIKKG